MAKHRDPTQGVLSVFDFVQSRKYYGLQIPIPSLIETLASWWTFQRYHTDRYDPNGYIQGRKTGLHLNFIPKYKIQVRRDVDGGTIIQLDYWARIRKTGIVAAFVTYGVTAAVGAGTLSYHVMEAKSFIQAFWQWFDGSYQVVKVEVLLNEERTALESESDDGSHVSKTSSTNTTNNYYNTYGAQQQLPPQQQYQQSGYPGQQQQQQQQQQQKSVGTVYPVSPIHSPASVVYPSTPPTPSQIPIPPPTTAAGAAYHHKQQSSSSILSPTAGIVGYQTTITSQTSSAYPVAYQGLGMGPHVQIGVPVGGYSYNEQQLEEHQHSRTGSGGYSSVSQSGSYGQSQSQSQSSAYDNNDFSGVQQSSSMRGSGYGSNYSSNSQSGLYGQQQQQQSSTYGTSDSHGQEYNFVQSLFGSTPTSSHRPAPPPPSKATLDSNSNQNNMGYNSSLPPYPQTASTVKPPSIPVSHPQMATTNTGSDNSNSSSSSSSYGSYPSNNNQQQQKGGPYPTGSYLGHEQEKKDEQRDTSLRHGGLGFGYTYDHLKEDIKRKSDNLNKTQYGNASN